LYLEQNYSGNFAGVTLATGLNATQEPFTPPNSIFGAINGYTTGFGFASFLLGDYGSYSPFFGQSSTTQTPQENYRYGTQQWGLFVQDSWKVLRKLTVDYGVRYDLATPEQEQYNRLGQLDASLANPVAGGRLGAVQYANTCNCAFYKPVYPYALGPRLGVAYQITPTTVFRAGWGYVYQFVGSFAGGIVSTNGIYNLSANTPAYVPVGQQFVNIQTPGSIVQPQWPVTNPFVYPNPGAVGPAPVVPDENQNRPPRVNQFSFGIQQQITRNFVVEASYVGNRGVWEQGASFFTGGGPYGFFSQVSPATYAQYGLYPFSHGLLAGGAFTWAKAFVRATPQDFFNTQSFRWDLQQVPPLDLTFNFLYTVPGASWEPRWANLITKDWQIGGYANYQSGMFLTPPSSPNANFLSSEDIRVPGQPL
jgi:hypothetical protein